MRDEAAVAVRGSGNVELHSPIALDTSPAVTNVPLCWQGWRPESSRE